ncbi:hypothetical protein H310_06015 [Aphanomyces invadans]|uniref:FAD-binding FR-type domain-containing protein n=1 Tax=Aphanomyces invadans TaxID=157072 RepID=A0A024U8C7_9STRA|nr:hypothetical protein H310_06015 [Aphanomyces invadans]ETW02519.1 hypothetical protein H310_06015 [Aphanomyces invadans]|eukprot:XP_008869124.1 hypothetical protein H310_06015 [Aphanomyces invadans]
MLRATALLVATSVFNVVAQGATPVCSSAAFAAQTSVPIGPFSVRSLVNGTRICIEVNFASTTAKWAALSLARSANMINVPNGNAVVFDSVKNSVNLHELKAYSVAGVPLQADQSGLAVHKTSSTNGILSFTFERNLVAPSIYDVDVDPAVESNLLWAHADTAWPSLHTDRGAVKFNFVLGSLTTASADAGSFAATAIIGAVTFGCMVLLGLLATHIGRDWHCINHRTVCPPSQHRTSLSWIKLPISDLKIGEAIVVFLYVACIVAVCVTVKSNFPTASSSRLVSLISGHIALVALMFLLLPVARGQHWEVVFGTSHERILKFHRWLGRVWFVACTVHLVLIAVITDVTSTRLYGSQQVVPLYGFIAFLAFASMALLAIDYVRRTFYEVFYYYHRVASIVGLVFALLHSRAVQYAMIFPLVMYGLTFLFRLRTYLNRYATVPKISSSNTVVITLPATSQSTNWARTANPCSFFWINIPAVSLLEWHPFSAIVTPDGQSISFCIKAHSPGSFIDRVYQHVNDHKDAALTVLVDGPHGKPAINMYSYDAVVLVAGGIGITPMLNVINRHRHQNVHTTTFHLHWVVRTTDDILAVEDLMFPLPDGVKATFYVTAPADKTMDATSNLQVHTGDYIPYTQGKPILDEFINTGRYHGTKVGVMACGPPRLVQEAQWRSHNCWFDFHKEVFIF